MKYNEFRFYSPLLDADAARLSVVNERGEEFYAVVACGDAGQVWRERREEVLNKVYAAMMAGHDPGLVKVMHG